MTDTTLEEMRTLCAEVWLAAKGSPDDKAMQKARFWWVLARGPLTHVRDALEGDT